jgi:hypothetical protein
MSRVRLFSISYRFGSVPVPEPEDPRLIPDCRDLGTEDETTALKGKPETGINASVVIHSR